MPSSTRRSSARAGHRPWTAACGGLAPPSRRRCACLGIQAALACITFCPATLRSLLSHCCAAACRLVCAWLQVLQRLPPEARAYFDDEHGTFQKVTDISGVLKPVAKEARRAAIAREAAAIVLPERTDLYLPVDPHKRLVGVLPESGRAMQSAAKTPILLAFDVEALPVDSHAVAPAGGAAVKQACIFKVGDDCRQDVLALQVRRRLHSSLSPCLAR